MLVKTNMSDQHVVMARRFTWGVESLLFLLCLLGLSKAFREDGRPLLLWRPPDRVQPLCATSSRLHT